MKANLARRLSIESCKDEITTVQNAIEYACGSGKTSISTTSIKSGTITFLKDEGYTVTERPVFDGTVVTIAW